VPRPDSCTNAATLEKTLAERGDPTGMFPAEITCSLE